MNDAIDLALVQPHIEPGAVEATRSRAEAAVAEAAAGGADLVALPELFTVGYFAFDRYADSAEGLAGPTLSRLANVAAGHDVALLAGSVIEDLEATRAETDEPTPAETGIANTAVLFDGSGERRLVFRKHHLFGYGSRETELVTPGERFPVAEVAGVEVGVAICYDLRYPGVFRRLFDAGAELVVLPSAWPYPRVEHWRTLARARAIENLGYVAAVNGVGSFDDASLIGRSAIYDPWGTTVASAADTPTTIGGGVDPGAVDAIRDEFPTLEDRRL